MSEKDIKPLHIKVFGSEGIFLQEGFNTGEMTASGILVETVWYANNRKAYGGCIDRESAMALHTFIGECLEKWGKESGGDTP